MNRSWAPRVLFLLAAVAQVGALMPLLLLSRRLMPVQLATTTFSLSLPGVGPSPLALLLVWLGGWAIAAGAPRRQGLLTALLWAAGLLLTWLGLPYWGRASSPFNLIFVLSLLPPVVAAWWGGARFGLGGVTWASTYDGLRLSTAVCLLGLLALQPFPPVGRSVALLGPLLLFTAGLPLLYLTRPGEEERSLMTTLAAVVPVLLVAGGFWLTREAVAGPLVAFLWRYVGGALEWVMRLLAAVVEPLYRLLKVYQKQGPPDEAREKGDWAYNWDDLLGMGGLQEGRSQIAPYVVGGVAVVVLAILYLLVRRVRKRLRPTATAELDEVRTGPGLIRGLLAELQSLLARAEEVVEETLAADHPRRLLRRLQGWGARQGRPRRPAETPSQYAAALRPLLPAKVQPDALAPVATAYAQVRYGSGQLSPTQHQAALAVLADLEQPGH